MEDYIIDGIPDYQLQSHARMQGFPSAAGLLQAFKKLLLKLDYKEHVGRVRDPIWKPGCRGETKNRRTVED